eukprot:CAMPEP_0201687862 /NCGR_PEP_ID=MMETSP0578-20130828/1725_1 /ASSEMBLY_ACC=CAM_ASM_000663 /TAXON_ID=267565 /ORGANISM="Skeletonema grethea, Strain CCMP 1804" /LENGTH=606 /DNA_ID=CAMNT_0048172041 /DNA_START=134 /DNA_END=1951 /DNA_ORIENTATION=+
MTSYHCIPPPAKKAKCETSWRSWRGDLKASNGKRFGLQDLLPGFTLRLEHREGGAVSTHRGEERILLFRSDKPGAIAKIIYSSEIDDQTSLQSSVAELQKNNIAHARIHVLDVKSQYRGRDLGGLLFSEAITHLRSKYCDNDGNDDDEFNVNSPLKSEYKQKQLYDVNCSLEAEEDVTRHGKLIDFYTRLGCHVASKRVQYMNDNDFVYRKVPMQITLKAAATTSKNRKRSSLMCKAPFLPVQLVGDAGKLTVKSFRGGSEAGIKFDWLISQADDGIMFSTTHGHVLYASPSGDVVILSPDDQTSDSIESWSIFDPIHISDEIDDREENSPRSLWELRSCHGTFLTADPVSKYFSCTKLPSFWQANGSDLRLACVSDTPPRRHHYLQCWKLQTHDYVLSMRSRFLNFSLGKATLFEALGWIHAFPAYPFHAWSSDDTVESSMVSSPSLRTLSYLMAEAARDEGLPDWVQLVALIHELGEAVKKLDPNNTGKMADSIYDWTISTRSRVVGYPVPDCATFSEFRHLNTDSLDVRYNTDTGVYESNCGLDSVMLVWTGAEFMYHLLRHNNTALPMEALAMVRYFLLGDWHEHHEYTPITNECDNDMLPW